MTASKPSWGWLGGKKINYIDLQRPRVKGVVTILQAEKLPHEITKSRFLEDETTYKNPQYQKNALRVATSLVLQCFDMSLDFNQNFEWNTANCF